MGINHSTFKGLNVPWMHDILFNLFGKKINKTVHPSQFALGSCNVVNMLLILFHSRFLYRIEIIGLLD